jgi:hypothetical protein
MAEPKCSLCGGRLVKEQNVLIAGFPGQALRSAWVCVECSAAFPIAVRITWWSSTQAPLYEGGKRFDVKGAG